MEKLVELLNEYEDKRHNTEFKNPIWIRNNDNSLSYLGLGYVYSELLCISKGYEFIERLVNNDKINKYKLEQEAMSWFNDESPVYGKDIRTDRLIMMLSVSNSPIKDLIYYLGKEDDEHYIKPGGYKLVFNAKK